jgi:hypothetical protein
VTFVVNSSNSTAPQRQGKIALANVNMAEFPFAQLLDQPQRLAHIQIICAAVRS